MKSHILKFGSLALALLGDAVLPVDARAEILVLDDIIAVRVLDGWRTESGTHMAALEIKLAEGWKTYWRAPGDGGIPPRFDWSGSDNLAAVSVIWPRPDAFEVNGMLSIGYHDHVVIPIELSPTDASRSIALDGEVDLGVCDDICVPVSVRVSADLPVGHTQMDARIQQALSQVPATAKAGGVLSVNCSVTPIADGLRVTATIDMPALDGKEIAVFELSGQQVWFDEARTSRSAGQLTAQTDLVPSNPGAFLLNRSDLRITVLGKTRAVDIRGCPAG